MVEYELMCPKTTNNAPYQLSITSKFNTKPTWHNNGKDMNI